MVWGGWGFLEDTGISFLYLFKYLFDISQYFCQYLSHVSPFVVKPRPSIINSTHMRWSGGILERVFNIAYNAPPNQSDVFTNTQSIKQILKMHSTWLILVLDGYFRKLVHPLRASWVEQFKCWISNKFHCFDLTCKARIYAKGLCRLCISAFRTSAFPVFSFLFLIEQPVRGLASGVLGDLVADEVYLYFMVIVAPPTTQGSQKKL